MAVNFENGEGPCSLVFDPGNYSMRIGYAGEGLPKAEIPSFIGVAEDEKAENSSESSSKRFQIGSSSLHNLKEEFEVKNYMKDGMVENWEMFYEVLVHSYASVLSVNPTDHPVLCSEAPWNETKNRERVAEIFFEDLQVPAYMSVKNAVLASFANGRATSIVIDSGVTHTSAIPIHDGFCLQSGIVKTPLGGSFVNEQCKNIFNDKGLQMVDLALPNDLGEMKNTRKSYKDFLAEQMLEEFKANVLMVSEVPYNEELAAISPKVVHKFPNGQSESFGAERASSVEHIFDRTELNKSLPERSLSVSDAVISAISSCENDLRPALYSSVILTGGNSLIQGFPDRLSRDISLRTPSNCKFKLISPSGPKERRLASWIGGSIVASLPSFPKMVASKEEYFEYGRVNIMRKFP